jgi:large-conductance mechanosensitive channel
MFRLWGLVSLFVVAFALALSLDALTRQYIRHALGPWLFQENYLIAYLIVLYVVCFCLVSLIVFLIVHLLNKIKSSTD